MTDTASAPRADLARIVFFIAAAIALSHLAAPYVELAWPWEIVWKAAGIALLGVYALGRGAQLAGLALFLSAVGDVMLELPQLVAGMGAFGLAHILYIAVFAGYVRNAGLDMRGWPLAALVVAISTGMLVWFFPDMGDLTAPGIGYQAIITVMVATAMLSRAPLIAKAGAVLFMLSDSLIALELYKQMTVPQGSVWITYALAQILLARGFAEHPASRGT